MSKCAFLTMKNLEGFYAYDHLAHEPLAARGWSVEHVPWRTANVHWDQFDLVVIRSPWDYQQDPQAFLTVLERIEASSARLENSLRTVQWNIRKTYLSDLQAQGVTIVPTLWNHGPSHGTIGGLFDELDAPQIVIKPIVGANADDTFRLDRDAPANVIDQVVRTFAERECMIQPFVSSIVSVGEYSLFFFSGDYSHCVLKTPQPADFRVQEEHGGVIRSVHPDGLLINAACDVLEVLETRPLYARVDLVWLDSGAAALMELELIEPSLYFAFDDEAATRFADAVVRLM